MKTQNQAQAPDLFYEKIADVFWWLYWDWDKYNVFVEKFAVESLATSIIVAHNHPSGNLQPSEADKQLTYKLKSSCLIMDIALLDHVILTADGYLSLSDEGYL